MSIIIKWDKNLVFNQVRETAHYSPKLQIWLKRAPNVNMTIIDHIQMGISQKIKNVRIRAFTISEADYRDSIVTPLKSAPCP